jgi:hypothetical protein
VSYRPPPTPPAEKGYSAGVDADGDYEDAPPRKKKPKKTKKAGSKEKDSKEPSRLKTPELNVEEPAAPSEK